MATGKATHTIIPAVDRIEYHLTLSPAEAMALRIVLARIGGDCRTGPRGLLDDVHLALSCAGVPVPTDYGSKWLDISPASDYKGLMFTSVKGSKEAFSQAADVLAKERA